MNAARPSDNPTSHAGQWKNGGPQRLREETIPDPNICFAPLLRRKFRLSFLFMRISFTRGRRHGNSGHSCCSCYSSLLLGSAHNSCGDDQQRLLLKRLLAASQYTCGDKVCCNTVDTAAATGARKTNPSSFRCLLLARESMKLYKRPTTALQKSVGGLPGLQAAKNRSTPPENPSAAADSAANDPADAAAPQCLVT